jgi:hypothetical protein
MPTAISERLRGSRALAALCLTVVLVLCAGANTRVRAQSDEATRAEGGERFKHGVALVGEGHFEQALAEFQRAYELTADYRLLFNIGQVMQRLEDYAGALAYLERYLAEGGERVATARREAVETEILRLHERVTYLSIRVDEPGAEVLVDDQPRGVTPLSERLLVSVGNRKVVVQKAGYEREELIVRVGGGEGRSLHVKLRPKGDSAEPQQAHHVRSVPWLAWGITGGLVIGSTVTGALALVAKGDAEHEADQLTTKRTLDDAEHRALVLGVTTDVLAASALGVGVYALFRSLRPEQSGARRRVSAELGLRNVRLKVRF